MTLVKVLNLKETLLYLMPPVKPDFPFLCIRMSCCTLFELSAPVQAHFTHTSGEEREKFREKWGQAGRELEGGSR